MADPRQRPATHSTWPPARRAARRTLRYKSAEAPRHLYRCAGLMGNMLFFQLNGLVTIPGSGRSASWRHVLAMRESISLNNTGSRHAAQYTQRVKFIQGLSHPARPTLSTSVRNAGHGASVQVLGGTRLPVAEEKCRGHNLGTAVRPVKPFTAVLHQQYQGKTEQGWQCSPPTATTLATAASTPVSCLRYHRHAGGITRHSPHSRKHHTEKAVLMTHTPTSPGPGHGGPSLSSLTTTRCLASPPWQIPSGVIEYLLKGSHAVPSVL